MHFFNNLLPHFNIPIQKIDLIYCTFLQDVASRLGLAQDSIRHYGLNGDVNSVLLISDIVIYGSSQDEQGFPSLIIRAMTFGVPVILPDFPIMKKYVSLIEEFSSLFPAYYDMILKFFCCPCVKFFSFFLLNEVL